MGGFLKFVAMLALVLGGLFFGLQATCLSFWTVPSDDPLFSASIAPTLEPGDLIMTWRLGTPSYAELVRCSSPEVPGRSVVGRILGEPGDRVEGSGHAIFVNKRIISSARACPTGRYTLPHPINGDPVDFVCEEEETGGHAYTRLRLEISPEQPEKFNAVVPNDNFFLVSDNRAFHYDSREYGPLAKSTCKERIMLRLWSARGWSDADKRMSLIH
jgi:signal peptidase I